MTDRTAAENLTLDMLGDDLKGAVTDARDRLSDETIMARIGGHDPANPNPGFVHIEMNDPPEVLETDLTPDEAIAYLAALT